MDRFLPFSLVDCAPVRPAARRAVQRVLHALRQRIVGEPGADAADRRAVFKDAVLRGAAHDLVAQRSGACREPQAGRAFDARDGLAGHAAGSAHARAASRSPDLPVLLRGMEIGAPCEVWCADITYIPMWRGFMYLVAVMDWFSRYVIAWDISNSLENGFCVTVLQRALRSARPVIFNTDQGVHRYAGPGRRAYQHGWPRSRARQCVYRAVVAQRKIRRHLSPRVLRRACPPCGAHALLSLLQSRAPAQRTCEPNAGAVPRPVLTPGKFRRRFGAVPLRPCPTGSPPIGGHGLRSTAPKRVTPAAVIDPQRRTCYSHSERRLAPTVVLHLNLPRYLSKDGGKLNSSAGRPFAAGQD